MSTNKDQVLHKKLRDALLLEVISEERNKLLNQDKKNHHKKIGSIIEKILERLPDEV